MRDASVLKTLGVALGICLVCSLLVSTAAVTLRSRQELNKRLDRIGNILLVGGLKAEGGDVEGVYRKKVTPVLVNLETGKAVKPEEAPEGLSIESFDVKEIVKNLQLSTPIPPERDIAGIRRLPNYMVVYLVKEGGKLKKVILPVFGKGLWSTIYGFLALESDLRTVGGITFYEHGETPGLGGEIENPRWRAGWVGKEAFDAQGNLKIEVIKGAVDPSRPESKWQVDGLSGATLTTRGVDHLVRFWLGENGYGRFLKKLREGGR